MKIIGFNQGQLGDLVINLPACRSIKNKFPDCHLIFSINQKYKDAAPLFLHNTLIDDFVFWEGYDNWPTDNDKKILSEINPDILFHPMPNIVDNNWASKMHYTEIVCRNHGIDPPDNLHTTLTRYFNLIPELKNCIAINPFCSGLTCDRNIPITLCEKIIGHIHNMGYETIQLGFSNRHQFPTTHKTPNLSILEDTRIALSCKILITIDSGLNYVISGYNHKVLGLYSRGLTSNVYSSNAGILKNRAPINPNAIYLQADFIDQIPYKDIIVSIEKLLC